MPCQTSCWKCHALINRNVKPDFFTTRHVCDFTSVFSIMHIITSHAMSCIYLANFIVLKCHAPYISCVKCYEFPLGNILVERGQTFIYIQNSITGPCLKIYHSWYINSPRHVFILYTAMPITCYIQFLSLCPWKVRKSFISKCIYDKSLTRKLAIWQIIFSPCVQYCNGVSAFTMYICTILYFPVHLKLDFQIFSFFSTWT